MMPISDSSDACTMFPKPNQRWPWRRAFDRVSLDLIYARPRQSVAAWRDELREALAFETEHLSLYQLTIEPGTPFASLARTGALIHPTRFLSRALLNNTGIDRSGGPAGL